MKTIYPIFICFLLLGSILWAKTRSPKPNVLFISIDDLNDWVGFMDGHPQAKRLIWIDWPRVVAILPMLTARSPCALPPVTR